jgi:predicted unusual protein kinase regulating ubiquinone biosynthesis (AarF/ABC1/UbiB family)
MSCLSQYDFGMVGYLNPDIKERLVDILIGVIEKDAEVVMNTLVELGALVLPPDPLPVRRSIQFFLDNVGARPNREQTVAAIGDDLYATAYDKPFRLPAASIFLLRSLSTMEGVNKVLDPDFKFSEVAQPFADEILKSRGREQGVFGGTGGLARSLATAALTGKTNAISAQVRKRMVSAGSNAMMAVTRIEKIEKTLSQLERGDLKVRSRSTETERMLRKQYALSEASNYLTGAATTALLAAQVYIMSPGQNLSQIEGALVLASLSTILGLTYFRKTILIKKESFRPKEGEDK